jgi:hypothetical protein
MRRHSPAESMALLSQLFALVLLGRSAGAERGPDVHANNSLELAPHAQRRVPVIKALLVTGMGGSGTNTVSLEFARRFKINLGHEYVDDDGACSWPFAVRSESYPRFAVLYPPTTRFRRVLHIVRCPLASMSALQSHKKISYIFMCVEVPRKPEQPRLSRVCAS